MSRRHPSCKLGHVAMAFFVCAMVSGCASDSDRISPQQTAPATASITPVTKDALAEVQTSETQASTGNDRPATGQMANTAVPTNGKPLKIGLLLPLGGIDQTAQIAKGMKQAAEMALFEADRPNVQLIVKDDKGTADGAKAATDEAIKEGAEVILGPLFSRAVGGAAPVARAANVPLLTFSNDRLVAGNGVYVIGFSPEQDAQRVVAYASEHTKVRFAALLPDDGYGQVIGAAFREAVSKSGGTVVSTETYPAGANAMIGPSRRIVEAIRAAEASGAPIEAVFVPGGQDVLPQLGPLMAYAGFNAGKVKMLGSGAWEFANIGNNDTFVGGWYPGPDPQGWRAFTGRFVKAFGVPPPRMASVAYDAVTLAISLSSEAPGQRFTPSNLSRSSGFSGVDGIIRLQSNGIVERELAVLEVQKTGVVVLESGMSSAPRSAATPNADLSSASGSAKLSAVNPPRIN
jgi:branched-chain amino acid transport system substrate-binding protein